MSQAIEQGTLWKISGWIFVAAVALYIGYAEHARMPDPIDADYGRELRRTLWSGVGFGAAMVLGFHSVLRLGLWRWRRMHPKLVRFPDLTGTWCGVSQSGYFGKERADGHFQGSRIDAVVIIRHNFDRIALTTYHAGSWNRTLSCTLAKDEGGNFKLFLVYENRVDSQADINSAPHRGCSILDLHDADKAPKDWRLDGWYWTDKLRPGSNPRDRGTWGHLWLTWDSRKLLSLEEARSYLNRGAPSGANVGAAAAADAKSGEEHFPQASSSPKPPP